LPLLFNIIIFRDPTGYGHIFPCGQSAMFMRHIYQIMAMWM